MLDSNFMHKLGRHLSLASSGGRLALPYHMYGPAAAAAAMQGQPGGAALLGYPAAAALHPSLLQSQAILLRSQATLSMETLLLRGAGGGRHHDGAVSPGASSDKQGAYTRT